MKTLSLKILTLLLIIGVVFTACSDDDNDGLNPGELENIDIKIDDNQTFNMSNFIKSFEQIFVFNGEGFAPSNFEYTHNIADGKALDSYLNIVAIGKFGNKITTFTHSYNTNGVVISTKVEGEGMFYGFDAKLTEREEPNIEFEYEFDTKGYITKVSMVDGSTLYQELSITYNDLKQVVTIKHEEFRETGILTFKVIDKLNALGINKKISNETDADYIWYEYFVKDTNGKITKYSNSHMDEGDYVLYVYDTSGRTIKATYYDGGMPEETINYIYDSANRLIELNEDESDWKIEIWYAEDHMSMVDFRNYNGVSTYAYISDYIEGFIEVKDWDFNYDYNNNYEFTYCKTREYFYEEDYDDQLVSKKEYFEGTPENLELLGYVIVDTRDAANNYRKTKESIYNANNTLLYYITYEVSGGSIISHQSYLPDGTAISDPQEYWIQTLISNLDS